MAEPPQDPRPHAARAHTPRDAPWTSRGGSTAGLLSVLSSPNLSHGTRLFRWVRTASSGTRVWPRAALRLHAVYSVCAPRQPIAGLARRRTRLTRAAFAGRHFIYFYLGPKAILIFKSG